MEVGVSGFSSIPQHSIKNILYHEVRRELRIHFCFKASEGYPGAHVQNVSEKSSFENTGHR
jgi:hypothetical protein